MIVRSTRGGQEVVVAIRGEHGALRRGERARRAWSAKRGEATWEDRALGKEEIEVGSLGKGKLGTRMATIEARR